MLCGRVRIEYKFLKVCAIFDSITVDLARNSSISKTRFSKFSLLFFSKIICVCVE